MRAPTIFLQHIKQAGIIYNEVWLHMHWCNEAKKTIQTFKNHFIAILSGVWDQLLPQTELTLNMLRATTWATMEELGHSQPPMHIHTDNSTGMDIITNTILPKVTKAKDMKFHWLHGGEQQKHCVTQEL